MLILRRCPAHIHKGDSKAGEEHHKTLENPNSGVALLNMEPHGTQ